MSVRSRRRADIVAASILVLAIVAGLFYWRESTRWFLPAEVERTAQPRDFITPEFPDTVAGGGYVGKLRLEIYVDENGAVDHVDVVGSTLPAVFGERATQAFKRAKFEPARRFGRAVRSVKTLELEIEPPPPGGGPGNGSSRGGAR
jgi:TonB family protein